eukprot:TRINITY_DN1149_c0_g1_i2.p1 TRINITY_DN1149_c0_g1~~TRINITY_DN1149_c0_g1_i2.p1  ORF type:complete len:327 (+),score=26.20 TRINITY_DN1149_c0_g1_i2:285-1265(+)
MSVIVINVSINIHCFVLGFLSTLKFYQLSKFLHIRLRMGENKPKKVLLMGPSGTGKTSMRSIIFANFVAKDTQKIQSTLAVERSSVRFLDSLTLSLWDCGAQFEYFRQYLTNQRELMFSGVAVLIYVLDVKSVKVEADLKGYEQCVKNLAQFSPDAKLFCLVHKMDLIPKDDREKIINGISTQLQSLSQFFKLVCFETSIWEETLYKAWSSIVYSLIPNAENIYNHLTLFMNAIDAEEVILFEKATFLDISHTTRQKDVYKDSHRFERISTIIKMFKLSCVKSGTQLKSMLIRDSKFDAYVDELTTNAFIMVITSDRQVSMYHLSS